MVNAGTSRAISTSWPERKCSLSTSSLASSAPMPEIAACMGAPNSIRRWPRLDRDGVHSAFRTLARRFAPEEAEAVLYQGAIL
ncbi:hypothetical protein [Mesorhizobium sp. B1-1-5]|uniref:hypothetical protein n=1 Tax=Mesorhizobium sp. B1-1-5 TaxID=2589979 RepID=UPI00112BEEB0|nr:hypothetical protein [Mesorhizobium sp. B1-1-5]TPO07025.1 hypothetical protein FJ980_12650 [Mesorhizobium sp. B1-1-5]